MPLVSLWIQQFCKVESCCQPFPIRRPVSVYARSLQPNSRCVSVRAHGLWGRERGKGKYCTAPQHCGHSVETCGSFGSFFELFKGRGKKEEKEIKIKMLLIPVAWTLCKKRIQ